MQSLSRGAAIAAAAWGLIGAVGCGGDEEAPRREGVAPMAAPGSEAAAPPPAGVGNEAPRIESVRFEPSHPGVGQSVRAIVEANDPDGDGVRLGYAWSLDGESLPSREAEVDLSMHVRRGATLELRVTASDGNAESEPYLATTSIGNRPPRIANLVIQPAGRITAAGPITAIATGSDPDDDEITWEYTWTVNGATSDERGAVFPDSELKRGDVVQLSVVARDDQGESEPLVSPEIRIENAAPVITSQPDLSGADATFAYRLVAQDADGDRLRFGLGKVPDGMTVAAESGEVSWTPREDQAGAHAVELWAEDPQGARASQTFELTISAPQAPATPPAAPAPSEPSRREAVTESESSEASQPSEASEPAAEESGVPEAKETSPLE
jgi:hypothetical protein